MPNAYQHFQVRIEVRGGVASESPFDSGTLWGRILYELKGGTDDERKIADGWLAELRDQIIARDPDFLPPLILSEGFQCDSEGKPWVPIPLSFLLELQSNSIPEERNRIKRIEQVPFDTFQRICDGEKIQIQELTEIQKRAPHITPALQPHLAVDRLSGGARQSLLYLATLSMYSSFSKSFPEMLQDGRQPRSPEILFFMKLRKQDGVESALKTALARISRLGWGHGKSRGQGQIRIGEPQSWEPSPLEPDTPGFVALSHFSPSDPDPTEGYWKLHVKHPVPAPFVDGKKVVLGEEDHWRVKSFLRLRAGSCLYLKPGEQMRQYYGRTLTGLMTKAEDHTGAPLPTLLHYALCYPWPLKRASLEVH